MKEYIFKVWNYLKGKKTYFVAICGLVYGFYYNDKDAILLSLGLLGLRHGISNEVANLLVRKRK